MHSTCEWRAAVRATPARRNAAHASSALLLTPPLRAITVARSAGVSTRAFLPDNVVLYAPNTGSLPAVDDDSVAGQTIRAANIALRDTGALPSTVQNTLNDVLGNRDGNTDVTVLITDADGIVDTELLEVMARIEAGDESDLCDLGDDFVLLANDGLVGGPTLTTENLTAAQLAAREDYAREMLEEEEAYGDDDEDDYYGSDDGNYHSDDDRDDKPQVQHRRRVTMRSEPDIDRQSIGTVGLNGGTSYRARRALTEYYAQSIADNGQYERSEMGECV